jgi:transcriptional regulator with XRE-family HTH domain
MSKQHSRKTQPARNATAHATNLGSRLREVRRERGITLRQVAAAAGVTESFVSQVERGTANPSVATLRRMAEALGETMASLFVGTETTGMVVRAGERRRLHHPSGSEEEYLLTPQSAKSLEIIYAVLREGAGSGSEPYAHQADEECVIVIAGQLDVGVNGELHHLDTGDALLLDPKLPHSYHNPGPGSSTTIWVMSPPGY